MSITKIRDRVHSFLYRHVLKPILFKIEPEAVHERFVKFGQMLGSNRITKKFTGFCFNYKNSMLHQKILGITFQNPIGLSAGFDYDAKLTEILPHIGFGFASVGSVTFKPYEGNLKPRLARLPKSKSLLVNKGLKSSGIEKIIEKLKDKRFAIPIGFSVAKTNCRETANDEEGIKDYVSSLRLLNDSRVDVSYYELNISCPNAFGGEPFTTPKKLDKLLKDIDNLKLKHPLFLKMPVDFSVFETKALCDIAKKHNVHGLIFGNLTKDRKNKHFHKGEISKFTNHKGAFSGKPTFDKSNALIEFAYKNYGRKFIIVGCGGIFTADDAYKKIRLGASLVQMITGMIYNGPSVISEINQGLAELLEKDVFNSVSEAIGVDNK